MPAALILQDQRTSSNHLPLTTVLLGRAHHGLHVTLVRQRGRRAREPLAGVLFFTVPSGTLC
jgi:hypothetical protein